ncbi:MAG: BtrH N-terminal domain-containing protein [Actinomycetota bacterium]
MTDHRNFKRLVRDRMADTGERYAAARAQILAAGSGGRPGLDATAGTGDHATSAVTAADRGWPTGTFDAVTAVGGQQPDLAAARNLCANAGVGGPDGGPLSEAMAFGLAGGIGFLYGVFSYDEGPTMTIVARHESMPDPFCEPLFARVGATVDIATTGGAKTAAITLDRVLAAGRPALCTVGAGGLGYLGESADMAGMAPHLVGVVGAEGSGDDAIVLLDDRAPVPIAVPRADVDLARGAYTKAKHRLITVDDVDPDHDWSAAIVASVTTAAERFDTPPVPRFAANVGRAGLAKFHRLLTDTGAKGWPRIFAEGRTAAIGLSRLQDCIDHAYTAPSAGRRLYADFLTEALPVAVGGGAGGLDQAGAERWAEAAERLRAAADAWDGIVALATGAHPDLVRYAELSAERAAALDTGPDPTRMAALAAEQHELIERCDLGAGAVADTFAAIAERVAEVIDHEGVALDLLAG